MSDNERKETKTDPNNYQEKKKVKYVPGKLLRKPPLEIIITEPLPEEDPIVGKLKIND